ncbi:hypothetical protein ACLB1R_08645 [Escherichia coli]
MSGTSLDGVDVVLATI